MKLGRKDFLLGLGGAMVGLPAGFFARGGLEGDVLGGRDRAFEPKEVEQAIVSYSQSGEDVVVGFILGYLKIEDVTYLDIGAYDPILLNNTYYFYLKGHRGVLVEPNVAFCEKLRAVRPEDRILEAGIGVTAVREAEYYVMSEASWSTFSKEEAEHQERVTEGRVTLEEVRRMPLLDVNEVMEEHFRGAPTFLSIDAEGWHLPILKAIDYRRFRPKVICVETLVSGGTGVIPEIGEFMETEGYVDRGGSFVNTIFLDSHLLE